MSIEGRVRLVRYGREADCPGLQSSCFEILGMRGLEIIGNDALTAMHRVAADMAAQ